MNKAIFVLNGPNLHASGKRALGGFGGRKAARSGRDWQNSLERVSFGGGPVSTIHATQEFRHPSVIATAAGQ